MNRNYRRLIVLIVVLIALVEIVAGARILNQPHPPPAPDNDKEVATEPLSPDPSFYVEPPAASLPGNKVDVPTTPAVTAPAYLVGNVLTGKIYLEKNSKAVLPVASMSKLITAFAVTDILSATTTILITELETAVASDTSQLTAGERFTVKELLYPLLLNSSNVAAEALASSTDRARFMELMSSYAWEVGMPTSHFADPSGLNPRNVSSARDFFGLARYLYLFRPDILAITRIASTSVATTTDHNYHDFVNIHPFVRNPDFLGGKTGHTLEARDTMLTIMKINDQIIAIIVLRSNTGGRTGDTKILIEEFKKRF